MLTINVTGRERHVQDSQIYEIKWAVPAHFSYSILNSFKMKTNKEESVHYNNRKVGRDLTLVKSRPTFRLCESSPSALL